jgi:DNA-binding PadR family transcriptional regulator
LREHHTRGFDRPGRPHLHELADDRPAGRRRQHHRHGRAAGQPGGPHGFRQARRGAVRETILRVLADESMHGYQLMQAIADRTGGRWHPSAGSIYPNLQQLEDEGLISGRDQDGRRVYALTDAGRATVASLPTERSWPDRDTGGRDLRGLGREVGMAAMQVSRMGSAAAVDAAAVILTAARRDLYRLLADDQVDGQDASATDATDATGTDATGDVVADEG